MHDLLMKMLPYLAIAATLALPAAPALASKAIPAAGQILVADANQDGRISPDDFGQSGAVFIPNLDDDGPQCQPFTPTAKADLDGLLRAESCSDAADERVDGPQDLADLARVKLLPQPSLNSTGRLRVTGSAAQQARVFIKRGGTWVVATNSPLTKAEIREGAELAVEGTDLITAPGRDRITLTVSVDGTALGSVDLRLARLVLDHDLMPVERLLTAAPFAKKADAAKLPTSIGDVDLPTLPRPKGKSASKQKTSNDAFMIETARYEQDFHNQLAAATAGIPLTQVATAVSRWTQDQFETGTVRMGPHTMRVVVRPPYGELMPLASRENLRSALGPNVAIAGQVLRKASFKTYDSSLDAGGNIEPLPPTASRPDGAILMGTADTHGRHPDRTWTQMLSAQSGSSLVNVDTGWLDVGHVDEFLHVLRDDSEQGWTFAVADPRGTLDVLRQAQAQGHGSTIIRSTTGGPNKTIDQLLADPTFVRDNDTAARLIDTQLAELARQLGTRPEDLVRLPALFRDAASDEADAPSKASKASKPRMVALTPAVVNGLSLSPTRFVAAAPHGPIVNGVDLFAKATEEALGKQGITVTFVENRGHLHNLGGEVHCGTNAFRASVS